MWHHRIGENNLLDQIKTQTNLVSIREERVTVESARDLSAMKEICIENFDWAKIPNSLLRIGMNHSKLWFHLQIALTLFNHHTHAKPPLHHIADTELTSLLVPCCAPEAHNNSGGHAQADKMIFIS